MLHESPRPAACRHVLHLLHILDPYEPNCRQSSEMVPHPGILDDMTPPPRPCIPMQGFWHFPAKKEGTRFYRHAEKLFQAPPCLSCTTYENAHRFVFAGQHVPTLPDNGPTADVCSSTERGPRHPAPCVRITHGLASPPASVRHRPASSGILSMQTGRLFGRSPRTCQHRRPPFAFIFVYAL